MELIAEWLASLGLSEYAQRFAENDIDESVLQHLTDQHLEKLGVSLGHRLKMLRAISELAAAAAITPAPVFPDSKPREAAERRQLTVMFCDLVGSTALSARLDPEDLRTVIGTYHRCCTEVIARNGGFVAKYMGDGVLAYFGYPHAHEHDAEHAVRAGLALVEAAPKLKTVAALALQVRVGIATGLVVVGDLVGSGSAQEQAVVGETPNLAARLQALAKPGTVVIASSTRTLTGGLFDYRDLGTVALKGFAESLPAFQVLGAGAIESRFEALRTTTTPLIGRDEEIERLMRRWHRARNGDGSVALVSGEPGIGKSRVAQAFQDRLGSEPYILRYFCSPHHQDSALYPIINQLERAAGFRRDDSNAQRRIKLETILGDRTDDLNRAIPVLTELLSISVGYGPNNLTPQKRKEKTRAALLAQVEGFALRQPVLMVFEDAQWMDPTSREVLDLIIEHVPRLPVLLIITHRPEFVPPWFGYPHVMRLALDRLPLLQRAEMVRRVAGDKTLPREIADQIVERADGIPLFIEELTKAVVESGVAAEVRGRYQTTGPLTALAIPTSLHASLLARLDRLASIREVAQVAAALGRQFSHELIRAVAPMTTPQLDDALEQLVAAELIFRRGTPPDAEYTFKHALVQDAAYSTLLRTRRQEIHARIAATLEERFRDMTETQPELLALHCAEAGLEEKAVGYLLKAGQQAIARGAMTEGVAQLQKGLNLLTGLPDDALRGEQELNLQLPLGHALLATRGYGAPEPGEAFARARQLCEQSGRPQQLGPALYGQWAFRVVRGELEQAKRHAEEIRHLGEVNADVMWRFFGSHGCGIACSFLGKFRLAREYSERALALWNPIYRSSAPAPEDSYVSALLYLSRSLLCLGYLDRARLRRDEALAEARRLSPYTLSYALSLAWYGDSAIEGAESATKMLMSAKEMLTISGEHGFPLFQGAGNIMHGWGLAALGRAAEGIPQFLEGLKICRGTGCNLLVPFWLTALADVYGKSSQPQEGLSQLAAAAELIDQTKERWAEPELHRVRGTLLAFLNRHDAAEQSYRLALELARSLEAKFWELRAALELARLLCQQGKFTEARGVLAPVYRSFTEGFDTPLLQDAKSLLDQLL